MKELDNLLENLRTLKNKLARLSVNGVSTVDRWKCQELEHVVDDSIAILQEKVSKNFQPE